MKLFSFANSNHVGLINLTKSIQPGWELIILGKSQKWEGWKTRMNSYMEACKKCLEDEVIVLCDAFDILCLRYADSFEDEFKTFQVPIVVGAETGCAIINCHTPTIWWKINNTPDQEKRKYVNGGLIAGRAGDLGKMWEWILDQKYNDDQFGIGKYADAFPRNIDLDIYSKLFFNDHLAETKYQFNKEDRSIIYEGRVIKPFFIHFHGVNINSSIPILNMFNNDIFKVGRNYLEVGSGVNGDDHLTSFPADRRGVVFGICIERAVFALIIIVLFITLLVIFKYKK